MRFSWTERLALRVLRFIPRPVAESPERVLINFACVLIGLSGLTKAPPANSVLGHWPHWFAIEWSLSMVAGGLLTLIGISIQRVDLERFGVTVIGLCALVFGVTQLIAFWPRAIYSAPIFLGIAAAKAVRFIVGSAARARLLHPPPPPPEE